MGLGIRARNEASWLGFRHPSSESDILARIAASGIGFGHLGWDLSIWAGIRASWVGPKIEQNGAQFERK